MPPQVVERYSYDPYGPTYIEETDPATGLPIARLGASAYGNPFAWTGQRYDAAVNLYHFQFRSYSPRLGRWLQRDPLGYVDGVNLYQYVDSQPTFFTDPLGLGPVTGPAPGQGPGDDGGDDGGDGGGGDGPNCAGSGDGPGGFPAPNVGGDDDGKKKNQEDEKRPKKKRTIYIYYTGDIPDEFLRLLKEIEELLEKLFNQGAAPDEKINVVFRRIPKGKRDEDDHKYGAYWATSLGYSWAQVVRFDKNRARYPGENELDSHTTWVHQGGILHGEAMLGITLGSTAKLTGEQWAGVYAKIIAHEMVWHGMGGKHHGKGGPIETTDVNVNTPIAPTPAFMQILDEKFHRTGGP